MPTSEPDVVTTLNTWLEYPPTLQIVTTPNSKRHIAMVQRARDEIVALRAERDETGRFVDRVKHLVQQARDEALEEAARYVEDMASEREHALAHTVTGRTVSHRDTLREAAFLIRSLKDKADAPHS